MPPPPEGRTTGFPYSFLWEEFAQIWEDLGKRGEPEKVYESLLTAARAAELTQSNEPSQAAIHKIIRPLGLSGPANDQLAAQLYRIAAPYRIPQLKIGLGLGAAATKAHLGKVARAAAGLAVLLERVPFEEEMVLGVLRRHADPDAATPVFNLNDLKHEIMKLAATATMVADEVPQMPRGTSTNILPARLLEAATRAIGGASGEPLEVLQADTAGRNPRPKNASARVLFDYMKLVDPSITSTALVRLLPGHNYGLKRLTLAELTE